MIAMYSAKRRTLAGCLWTRIVIASAGMVTLLGCAATTAPPMGNAVSPIETGRAEQKPTQAGAKTSEESSQRAADPKDPSGALIVAPGAAAAPAGR